LLKSSGKKDIYRRMRFLFCFILAFYQVSLYASALLIHDHTHKVITAKSHLFLYGEADEELAKNIATEINQVWNEGGHQVLMGQVKYDLVFEVSTSVTTLEIARELSELQGPINNFIRILAGPNEHLSVSFIVGNTNSGVWLLSDQLGLAKTAAHEYGHTLGLEHPEGETFVGIPRIMLTRYYDPNLDLRQRKVLDIDIQELGINEATTTLGNYKTTFLFDEEGNLLAY
jgi:hypothetical protein